MMFDRSQIREGMTVLSSDGEKLGKVQDCGAATFTVEKGFFFPKDYVARYEEISDASGDEIRLAMTKAEFDRLRESGDFGAVASSGSAGTATRTGAEDIRVPVAEEQVDVMKRDREAGEVRLRKDVVTETKHIDVPVTREEVHVERTPVTEPRAASPGERPFEKQTVSVPVHEEEVEIRKRPVVKEEVRVRKDRVTEQRAAQADVRKEKVDVEDESGRIRDPETGVPRRSDEEI